MNKKTLLLNLGILCVKNSPMTPPSLAEIAQWTINQSFPIYMGKFMSMVFLDNSLIITFSPQSHKISFSYQFSSVQTLQPLIVIYWRDNFVHHHWGCTSAHQQLSYPLRSLHPKGAGSRDVQAFYVEEGKVTKPFHKEKYSISWIYL